MDKTEVLDISMNEVGEQRVVNEYFDEKSTFWKEIYREQTVYAVIHQQRHQIALGYFESLCLPKTSRLLEIGCGAGWMTVDLAKRGYTVEALDSVEAMITLTRQNAQKYRVEKQVRANPGDVYRLPYPDHSFDCIMMLGVIPWLSNLKQALREVGRVLRKDAYIIISADNRYRLNHLVDPLRMPFFSGLKEVILKTLKKIGLRKQQMPSLFRYSPKKFIRDLDTFDIAVQQQKMIGYGPFTFLRYPVFTENFGLKVHYQFQELADRGFPILRSTGTQYIF